MMLHFLLVTILISYSSAQFGAFNKAAQNSAQSAAKAAKTGANQAQAFAAEWLAFKKDFNKAYSPAEEAVKNANFIKNLDFITKFAKDFADGVTSFTLKMNQFGDLLNEEFNKLVNGYRPSGHKSSWKPLPFKINNTAIPKSINWIEKGAVTPIKNQGECGSCHAFAACAAVEGHTYLKTGKLVELSPQNIIDCTKGSDENYGCDGGGFVDEDFKYISDNHGANSLSAYPYEGKDGECRFDEKNTVSEIKGFVVLPLGDEKALQAAVAQYGPIAVGIDASLMTFRFYGGGIYDDANCKSDVSSINHAITIVGYGTEHNQDYWLLKNSYGTKWGNNGYMKMARNKNMCAIATIASFPVVY